MRRAGVIAILLIVLVLFAGCGQRVPTRNSTSKNPWGNATPTPNQGSAVATPVVPTTTSPFQQVTVYPTGKVTPVPTNRNPPPIANATANLTLLDEKNMVFIYNRTAFTYNLETPPLLIDYTLTVPNITKTRVVTDPVSGDDETVTITYPDPAASFEVTVRDVNTKRVLVQNGYGGNYDVAFSKQIWVRYPGNYYIEFFGTRLTADIKFWVLNGT